MFGMFGRRRPPPFFGGGQFGGRRPFPGMYRGMPTFMNRRPPFGGGFRPPFGGGFRPPFGGMQRPPFISGGEYKKKMPHFGGGFRPPFGGNEGGFGGTDYSAQISELEKKIKELQAQLSGQPAASPAMPEPLPAMPKPPTASYNPVPQVDVDAFQQFKAGISPDRDEYLAGIRAENQLRQDKINSGELVPDPTQMDRGPRRYVTKAEAEMRMRQRDANMAIENAKTPQQRQAEMMALNRAQEKAAGIAGISLPDFNAPPGIPAAIPAPAPSQISFQSGLPQIGVPNQSGGPSQYQGTLPNFNTPPGTPIAIPPSAGGQYEEPAREFLKGTPAPLDPNYILQPGDPGYLTSGYQLPSNIQFKQRGGIESIGNMMNATGGRAAPPSYLQATPHTPTGQIFRMSPEVIAQAKARRMSRR